MTLTQITVEVELTEEEILADLVYPAPPDVAGVAVAAGAPADER